MFSFDLQRFGSTTVQNSTPVNGATQLTETGKEIEGINRDYLRVLSPILQNLANTGGAQVGTSVTPDYNAMYGSGLNQVNQANSNISSLASGQLPSAYQANMKLAVQDALSPYGNSFNTMAGNGVINSSVGKQWATDAATAGNNAAINAYNTNMNSALGLNQAAVSSAANPYNYAAGFQSAAGSNAKDLLSLATGSYTPVGSTFSDYLKAGTGQKSSSSSSDSSGFGSVLGTGLGLLACFPADTMIATPDGDKPIQDVNIGDTVSTLCGPQEVSKTIQSLQPIVTIETDRGNLFCTQTEVLLTVEGSICVEDLIQGDILIHKDGGATVLSIKHGIENVPVYELVAPYFYADGFVVDGFDPQEV